MAPISGTWDGLQPHRPSTTESEPHLGCSLPVCHFCLCISEKFNSIYAVISREGKENWSPNAGQYRKVKCQNREVLNDSHATGSFLIFIIRQGFR
jgi:hypothetical protein